MERRIIFHVDVNSAFLSWEAIYRLKHLGGTLDLREVPSVVGGDASMRHGIVLAKSLKAKQFNIKTGESLMEARQKCPELLVVPPHYHLYEKCSTALMDILKEYSPDVEQYSIDEAYIDMSGTRQLWGEPVAAAHQIRERIRTELGFTVNIGISTNKLLAKMASDFTKPDRVHTLFPEEIEQKMWVLPVSELFYVGRAAFQKLRKLGIITIGDLAHTDAALLKQHLKSQGEVIWHFANGRDTAPVESEVPANKGYGNSTTTAFDVCDSNTAGLVLLSLAETIGMRLRRDNVKIEVISVGIKYQDFNHCSRQRILPAATDITHEIYQMAYELFLELWDHQTPIRNLGIHTGKVSGSDVHRQLSLFDIPDSPLFNMSTPTYDKLAKADDAIDAVRSRFGLDAVKRCAFLTSLPLEHASGGITRDKQVVDYQAEKVL